MNQIKKHLSTISTYSTLILAILTGMWFVHSLDQRITVLEKVVQINKTNDDATNSDIQKSVDGIRTDMKDGFKNLDNKMDKNFNQVYLLFSQQVLAKK